MFAKRLLQKAVHHHSHHDLQHGSLKSSDLDPGISVHYGIPSTASVLAFDPIQRLLAIGTLDGRIKVIGGDNIEGLVVSPKQIPYKFLEFLQNQGFIVGISNDNDIQVWSLDNRILVSSLQWESNITAFSAISGSLFIYVGDEHGLISVVKFEAEEGKLLKLPYHVSAKSLREAAGCSYSCDQPIVGVLCEPSSFGNRLLIAFEDGLIVLWDVSEAQILSLGGGKDLQLKDESHNSSTETNIDPPTDAIEQHLGDKEISALCWASSSGSILAVGYIDGDILFWNLSLAASPKGKQTSPSPKNVVKLQLSSAERRLPVIVLQWCGSHKSNSDCAGQLFVYGGDEIGSEEVLTVLTLEWSSGKETVKCIDRADLTLNGSFADMILLPSPGSVGLNSKNDLFVLTNPGQLHFYDNDSRSSLTSQKSRPSVSAMEFPVLIPTTDPSLTVAKLIKLPSGLNLSKHILEVASGIRTEPASVSSTHPNWPLTGGVPSHLSTTKSTGVERVYLAGYSDGSVWVIDATYPVLSHICYIEPEVQGIKVAGSSASVTKLDLCLVSLHLAVGNECGLVRVYDLKGQSDRKNFLFVTDTKCEVHDDLPQGKGPFCRAVYCLLGSPVHTLSFANSGSRLAVGFLCGRVAVCDMTSLSLLFMIDGIPSSSSPITSMAWKECTSIHGLVNGLEQSETTAGNSLGEILFILSQDGKVNIIEGNTGKMIPSRPLHLKESTAVSMYLIDDSIPASALSNGKQVEESLKDTASPDDPVAENNSTGVNLSQAEACSSETTSSGDLSLDPLVLLCCENSLCIFSAKSVIQGSKKPIQKVEHSKPCCWSTILKKDEKICGLLSLFQTGTLEIRSLPDLELVEESSLMSILRWSFKVNMDKTMCSDGNGLIALVNNSELAFINLLTGENNFRSQEHLPCLYDNVVAAAADAALRFSSNQKKKQGNAPRILGEIVKGFKGGKSPQKDFSVIPTSNFAHLEGVFLKAPFSDSLPTVTDHQETELDIDDIEIDEPQPVASSSSIDVRDTQKDKLRDREKLFQGGTSDDVKPRLRTPQEIIATYRKAGDASSVAAQARNKLMERQEKLERMSQRTAELQSGAEDFASLANELVKTMEKRKWWHI
ncbi:hypothetical protein L6164_002328 [Bauhinia variegata]|uniref:Uncharacterized protein n=1 Tax=Bauhinia variegata TaxID=167791 RepID=A0ACB9PYC7_BAUVA|nr:hypothetical protein L6164_002328 [Bauhinia variegata]